MESYRKSRVEKYYQENKEWIQKIAQSGDPIVRAMALAILEVGGKENGDWIFTIKDENG